MTRFMLALGAFHGGWRWEEVADRLWAAGHRVEAPDLPGAPGEGTPHAELNLGAAAHRHRSPRRRAGARALFGHSNGGIVITQAAAERPDEVRQLVHLAASRPVDGEPLRPHRRPEGAGDGVPANVRVEPPSAFFGPTKIKEVFAADCTPEWIAALLERIGSQPLTMFARPRAPRRGGATQHLRGGRRRRRDPDAAAAHHGRADTGYCGRL